MFSLPGLLKMSVQRKPATKARKGINPFTKEEITIKAKPARNVVKIRPLKNHQRDGEIARSNRKLRMLTSFKTVHGIYPWEENHHAC